MIRLTSIAILTIFLVGCSPIKPAQLDIQTVNTSLQVQDLRSPEQKKTEMLSYSITNCKYGIQRLGDERTSPNKIAFLKSSVARAFPNAKLLKIRNFVLYNNMQYQLREGNIFRGPIFKLFECDKNLDKFTAYTQAENPQREIIVIGTLNGSIDGKPFSARASRTPNCPKEQIKCQAQANAVKKILNEMVVIVIKQQQ